MARLGQFLEGLIQTFVHPWDTQEAKQGLPCDENQRTACIVGCILNMHTHGLKFNQRHESVKPVVLPSAWISAKVSYSRSISEMITSSFSTTLGSLARPRNLRIYGLRQIGSCQDDPRRFLQDASSSARSRILSRMVDRVALFLRAFFKYMPTFAFALARTIYKLREAHETHEPIYYTFCHRLLCQYKLMEANEFHESIYSKFCPTKYKQLEIHCSSWLPEHWNHLQFVSPAGFHHTNRGSDLHLRVGEESHQHRPHPRGSGKWKVAGGPPWTMCPTSWC